MARIPEEKIDEIRAAVNLVHYIGQFVNLKKAGQNYKGLCPFHTEKTPSFVVSPEKQIFRCFGCGKGGNIFSFIMEFEKVSFLEAVKKAADFAGITLPQPQLTEQERQQQTLYDQLYALNQLAADFFQQHLKGSAAAYLKQRALSESTIQRFKLGYAPDSFSLLTEKIRKQGFSPDLALQLGLIQKKDRGGYYDRFRHRIMFPFQNISGKILGFGGRKLKEQQQPKYLNSPESAIYKKGEILYGLHHAIQAIREKEYVILVEGYFDLLRLVDQGIKAVVASSGTALTPSQARLLKRYTSRVYLAYDSDTAGIKAAIRNATILEQADLAVTIIALPQGEDPDSFVLAQGADAFYQLMEKSLPALDFRLQEFKKNFPQPSGAEMEQFLQQILEEISQLANPVKLSLYVHQIGDFFNLNEGLLMERIQSLRKQRRAPIEKHPQTPPASSVILKGIPKAEAGIIALLLHGPQEVRNFLLQEITHDLFENQAYITLYEKIIAEIEEQGAVDVGKLTRLYQDNTPVVQALTEIALLDFSDPMKYARDSLFQLKKWQLEKRSIELKQLIKQEASSPDSLLHYNQQLMEVRKELDRLIKEHKKQ